MDVSKGRSTFKFNAVFIALLIFATVLAISGQKLANFFSTRIEGLSGLSVLTITTIMSIGLFITTYFITLFTKRKRPNIDYYFHFLALSLIGFFSSIFSIIVLAAWWG